MSNPHTYPSVPMQAQMTTATTPTPEAELLDRVLAGTIDRLDAMASRYADAIFDPAIGRLRRAMIVSAAIHRLREAISSEIMQQVMALMGSPLGFKTDRDQQPPQKRYTEGEVKDVLIAALLNGVFPVGNEFAVIAGQLYIAQNGYRRKVQEIPGLTDLEFFTAGPNVQNGQVQVQFGARWKLNGIDQALRNSKGEIGRSFPIITHTGTSPDAMIGKALRKGFKAIYDQVTGSRQTALGDSDDEPEQLQHEAAAVAATRTGQLSQKLKTAKTIDNGDKSAPATVPKATPDETPTVVSKADQEIWEAKTKEQPPSLTDALEADRQQKIKEIRTLISLAENTKDLQDYAGTELKQNAEWLGEKDHAALKSEFQARYVELSRKTVARKRVE